ncbi:hypothetical protein F994_01423 [Acinetobacter bohemicus ANC 3994]|uniref:Uncharacterized protein n=1 Tax=Acinetobacter bohemicus ANC 3994 TaxID=1217715 RepID=N8QGD1_9GAMM|nr:hypothetical protein [Acinetobacter bohemicus]ENU20364.1 hypothetical protein F994_01423 [Acinetobacter bohemicus ANC 3994]
MLNKLAGLFKSSKESAEQLFLQQQNIQFDQVQGYIVDGIVVNELSERLAYFSNRKLSHFDDLKKLYCTAMIINEKIDLEIANQRFVARLGNTEENLLQLKQIIQKLNDYYRQFLREK